MRAVGIPPLRCRLLHISRVLWDLAVRIHASVLQTNHAQLCHPRYMRGTGKTHGDYGHEPAADTLAAAVVVVAGERDTRSVVHRLDAFVGGDEPCARRGVQGRSWLLTVARNPCMLTAVSTNRHARRRKWVAGTYRSGRRCGARGSARSRRCRRCLRRTRCPARGSGTPSLVNISFGTIWSATYNDTASRFRRRCCRTGGHGVASGDEMEGRKRLGMTSAGWIITGGASASFGSMDSGVTGSRDRAQPRRLPYSFIGAGSHCEYVEIFEL